MIIIFGFYRKTLRIKTQTQTFPRQRIKKVRRTNHNLRAVRAESPSIFARYCTLGIFRTRDLVATLDCKQGSIWKFADVGD